MSGRYRGALLAYVAVVVALSLSAGLLAADLDRHGDLPPATLPLLAALLCQAEWLQVRYHHRRHVDALTLVEAALAPVLLSCSGAQAMLVVASGMGLAAVLRRNAPIKAAFNVAEWVLAAASGLLVLRATGGAQPSLLVLPLALVAASAVNQLAFAGVMQLTSGHPLGASSTALRRSVAVGRGLWLGTNLALGLLLAAAVHAAPATVLLAFPLLGLLHWAARSYATVRADRLRLAGLRAATSVLGAQTEPERAFPLFLGEVLAAFEVRAVHLALRSPSGWRVHGLEAGADGTTYRVDVLPGTDPLLSALAAGGDAVRLTAAGGDPVLRQLLGRAGWRSGLVVPVVGATAQGMLCLYDRVGMEGFEEGEPAIAAALAADVADFLERAALYGSLADERRKLAEIVDSSSDGILTLDAGGAVRSWNVSLERITGRPAEAMIGRVGLDLLAPLDTTQQPARLEAWADGVPLPAELEVATAAGGRCWLSCSYGRGPGPDGQGVLVIVARNVTQARELDHLKDDFLAIVSHELRTPLAPIKGWAKTLLHRGDGLTAEQRDAAMRAILGQAQRLEDLVLNILESSRNSGRSVAPETVDLADVVTGVVSEARVAQPDRTVEVRGGGEPVLAEGRRVWFERIVANLIGNAVKYSPDHEPVVVRLARCGSDVVLEVVDRGPGIAPAEHERIFERFARLPESRTQTGTGLGLYIARRLALAVGGDVTVTSQPGSGTTFTLRALAAAIPPQRQTVEHPPAAPRALSPPKPKL